ncbi:MAG: HAMP domain-containing sensor histidine kinase [Anaerolineae bacterium]
MYPWPRIAMPIRARLTLLYTIVLVVFITVFGLIVVSALDLTLRADIDQTLRDIVTEVWDRALVSPEARQIGVVIPPLNVLRASRTFIQIWRNDGTLVGQSGNLMIDTPLDPETFNAVTETFTDSAAAGMPLRVLTVPIELGDFRVGVIQAAVDLEPTNVAKARLARIMLGAGVTSVIISVILGAYLAGRALKPIDDITRVAQNIITADDLSRRIPYSEPLDELSRLTRTINNTLARLEHLFNAQRRFIADISHELRTPLTAIRGNLDLLRRIPNDEASLNAIDAQARRMSRLVHDLLLLAQADSGRLSLECEMVTLNELLQEVYDQAKVLSADREIDIALLQDETVTVEADPDRLMQLFINLTSNAIKYTPDGGRVTLGLTAYDGWARVLVSDTGIGIPEEDLPFIFERFYRVDPARSRAQGGAGLGLAIAKWIAEAHNGRITVESRVGHGTTFTVWLPAPKVTADETPEALKDTRPRFAIRRGRHPATEETIVS